MVSPWLTNSRGSNCTISSVSPIKEKNSKTPSCPWRVPAQGITEDPGELHCTSSHRRLSNAGISPRPKQHRFAGPHPYSFERSCASFRQPGGANPLRLHRLDLCPETGHMSILAVSREIRP